MQDKDFYQFMYIFSETLTFKDSRIIFQQYQNRLIITPHNYKLYKEILKEILKNV